MGVVLAKRLRNRRIASVNVDRSPFGASSLAFSRLMVIKIVFIASTETISFWPPSEHALKAINVNVKVEL